MSDARETDIAALELIDLKFKKKCVSKDYQLFLFVCLFVLMLKVPVNNFSVMSERSHRFLGITSTFRGIKVSLRKDTTRQR